MKKSISVIICLAIALAITAQSNYFIFIENSTKQPFSIKYNDVEYKGNSHITLSKLKPGNHPLTFIIPGNKPFTITTFLQDEDLGFLLRNNNAVWELQNINTQLVLTEDKPEPIKTKEPEKEIIKPVEAPAKTEEVVEKVVEEKPKDAPIVEPKKEEPKPVVDLISPKLNALKIRKAFENIGKTGIDQIYIVPNRIKLDTVAIYIPAEPKLVTETPKQTEAETKKETAATKVDYDNNTNTTCTNNLTTENLEILKNTLQQATTDKERVQVAIQTLTQQCLTINQAKQLGNNFETDEYRVSFFKSIKNNLTNTALYKTLADNIISDKWKAIFNESIAN